MSSLIGSVALNFSEEQSMLLDVARAFVRDKSPIDQVRAQLETPSGYDQGVWDEMVALGWTGIALPETVGGSALGFSAVIPVVEALGHGLLGTPLVDTTLAGQLLLRAGGAVQEATLSAIAAGEVATVAFLDGGDWGADNTGVSLDDQGVLQGNKSFVGSAQVASYFVVVGHQHGSPILAVVSRSAISDDAFTTNTLIDLTKRSCRVDFSGVRPEQVISGEQVAAALRDYRLMGALLAAVEATGTGARCLEVIVDYLKTRKQFGKLIGSYQALKHPTVDIYCAVEDSRSFCYHAASIIDESALSTDAETACRMAKTSAGDMLVFAGDRAVQFHGGIGFTWDCDSTLFIRRAQWTQQVFGDATHHRKRLASLLLD